jgi:small subunit ribosomal protein S16
LPSFLFPVLCGDVLKIRLQRTGKKKQAHFRVVVVEHTAKPQGKYLELLGTYNPHAKELKVDRERIERWLSAGAQISPTVNNLMVNHKVWDRDKMASWKPKHKEGGDEHKQDQATPSAEGSKEEPSGMGEVQAGGGEAEEGATTGAGEEEAPAIEEVAKEKSEA